MFDFYRNRRISVADYNNFKRFYRRKLEDNKRSFNDILLRNSNNKSKTVWKIIRGETTSDNSSDLSIYYDDKLVGDPVNLCDLFNDYFSTINGITTNDTVLNHSVKLHSNSMFLDSATISEVYAVIIAVSKKMSAGLDGIPCNILGHVAEFLAYPLTQLVNQ
ncbi:hypothetical protein QE152_g38372 [Popillia japonica]|uniref:Uncharacterized protein n=1 Tax=Popillia japonica TaxID=7064 RepID=A0AAW1HXA1_POPJA